MTVPTCPPSAARAHVFSAPVEAVLRRPPQHLQVPAPSGTCEGRPPASLAAVLPRLLQHLQVAALSGTCAGPRAQHPAILPSPSQHRQVPALSRSHQPTREPIIFAVSPFFRHFDGESEHLSDRDGTQLNVSQSPSPKHVVLARDSQPHGSPPATHATRTWVSRAPNVTERCAARRAHRRVSGLCRPPARTPFSDDARHLSKNEKESRRYVSTHDPG